MVEAIPRTNIPPSLPKQYQGFNRICQSLRHIATSVNWGMIGLKSLRPIEVQASVINGQLHVSSNFHSEHIQESLHFALTRDTERPIPIREIENLKRWLRKAEIGVMSQNSRRISLTKIGLRY
ncbi:hypothetical protein HXV84_11025 [Pseudomonas amygdali pv. morsprunorum]|nr:hypothetical protein [Pseudomonas amygdali pv. morsprunorum]